MSIFQRVAEAPHSIGGWRHSNGGCRHGGAGDAIAFRVGDAAAFGDVAARIGRTIDGTTTAPDVFLVPGDYVGLGVWADGTWA